MTKDTVNTKEILNASTLLLFFLFIGSTFCSVLCLDENQNIPGIILAFCGAIFLPLTVWSNQKRFYPILIGFFIYLIVTITLVTFFPKVIAEGIGFLSPYIYLTLLFLGFIYVISNEYKKMKS